MVERVHTTEAVVVERAMGLFVARASAWVVVVTAVYLAIVHGEDPSLMPWVLSQLIKCMWPFPSELAAATEAAAWAEWEKLGRGKQYAPDRVLELAPGERPEHLKRPFLVRGLLNGSSSELLGGYSWLTKSPVGDLEVDYFSNASAEDGIVPDSRGQLRDVVSSIVEGGPAKIGTEMIFRRFPHLLDEARPTHRPPRPPAPHTRPRPRVHAPLLVPPSPRPAPSTPTAPRSVPTCSLQPDDSLTRSACDCPQLGVQASAGPLLGGEEHLDSSRIGLMLTVPVFLATGDEGARSRTDLHCEPIGNLALQFGGRKRWTLVPPEESHLLRPSLSKDGRAYFQSMLPTDNPDETLAHVRRWVVETDTGDALWVPTWTWHRVDYLPGVTALAASLFHFRFDSMANNGLYSALAVPNVLKELVGWKTQ